MRDYHVHSRYSDGGHLPRMVEAAAEAGLEGVGFADHCVVSEREWAQRARARHGFALDLTHERRREAIRELRRDSSVRIAIYDAVELDYDPRDEDAIREFLDEADFDYTIGSVHALDGGNVHDPSHFRDRPSGTLDSLVDRYFEKLIALVESNLFDVAAHPDVIERTAPLSGRATTDHYRRAAHAFARSRTIPEINVGRALEDGGVVHPRPDFLAALQEHDVAFTIGTDSHAPEEVRPRARLLATFTGRHEIDPVAPSGV